MSEIEHEHPSCEKPTVLVTKLLVSCDWALELFSDLRSPSYLLMLPPADIHRILTECSCIHFTDRNFSNSMKESKPLGIHVFIVLLM